MLVAPDIFPHGILYISLPRVLGWGLEIFIITLYSREQHHKQEVRYYLRRREHELVYILVYSHLHMGSSTLHTHPYSIVRVISTTTTLSSPEATCLHIFLILEESRSPQKSAVDG